MLTPRREMSLETDCSSSQCFILTTPNTHNVKNVISSTTYVHFALDGKNSKRLGLNHRNQQYFMKCCPSCGYCIYMTMLHSYLKSWSNVVADKETHQESSISASLYFVLTSCGCHNTQRLQSLQPWQAIAAIMQIVW